MKFECPTCSRVIETEEVKIGVCPVCNSSVSIKKDKQVRKREYAKESRERLLINYARLREYVERFGHSSEECGVGDWVVIPKDVYEKTIENMFQSIVDISNEVPLKNKINESLQIMLDIIHKSKADKELITKNKNDERRERA